MIVTIIKVRVSEAFFSCRRGFVLNLIGLCISTDIFLYIGRSDIHFLSGSRADIFADVGCLTYHSGEMGDIHVASTRYIAHSVLQQQ